MARRRVFYSFDYEHDVMRVQQVRNMGILDQSKLVSANDWEEVKRKGKDSIKKWIDASMASRSCVIVLIGEQTAERPWVQYEIQKAWKEGKGLFGIYVHQLKCPRTGICQRGSNPFEQFQVGEKKMSDLVKCYDPKSDDAYNDIKTHLCDWVEKALVERKGRKTATLREMAKA